MSGDIVERLRARMNLLEARPILSEAAAEIEQLRALVEQAFRDGIAYATNCRVDSVDLAWEQSRARETLLKHKEAGR